jgi:dTDP-4-amino-4,6-dideoxygalactose transaminase
MEVQFLDLKKAYIELKPELDQLWQDINKDSFYVLGRRLEKFEKEFANYLGVRHVIGVGDGLDALALSIRALGIGHGDEVIVPAHTYIASWLAISEAGAVVVPVEADEKTYLIDPLKIERAITKKTRAIMVVHLYGLVCDMQPIKDIANKYNLKIIEDSAQAHGAFDVSSGIKTGALGDISGFSFYPGKNLGCFGDGGCISTNDDDLADKLRLLRNYGSKKKYEHEVIGINSRLDELQAGVLSIKLKCLDEWNKRRQKLARVYLSELKDIAELTLPEYNDGHVWYVFAIKTAKRDELQEFLSSKGISTIIHFPKPIYLQDAYKNMNLKSGAFEITEKISAEILSLPMGPHLTEEEVRFCSQMVKEFFG